MKSTIFFMQDFSKNGGMISAFCRIFVQSYELLKTLDFDEMRRIIGIMTNDSWGKIPTEDIFKKAVEFAIEENEKLAMEVLSLVNYG